MFLRKLSLFNFQTILKNNRRRLFAKSQFEVNKLSEISLNILFRALIYMHEVCSKNNRNVKIQNFASLEPPK